MCTNTGILLYSADITLCTCTLFCFPRIYSVRAREGKRDSRSVGWRNGDNGEREINETMRKKKAGRMGFGLTTALLLSLFKNVTSQPNKQYLLSRASPLDPDYIKICQNKHIHISTHTKSCTQFTDTDRPVHKHRNAHGHTYSHTKAYTLIRMNALLWTPTFIHTHTYTHK